MKPVFSFDEIREIEKNIIQDEQVPSLLLMENAGKNSCEIILDLFPDLKDYQIYILCGKGNNAGDGFVTGRHLIINGFCVNIVLLTSVENLKGDTLINFNLLFSQSNSKLNIISFEEFKKIFNLKEKNLLIDALLGTGIKRNLDDNFTDGIEVINNFGKNVKTKAISLDVPSGLVSGEQVNPLVKTDITITMGCLKTELLYGAGKENSGEIKIADIGIDDNAFLKNNFYGKYVIESDDIKAIFPIRKKVSHKYSNGKVLVIGGSKGLSGAVMMSSTSALKSGAGALSAAVPKSVYKLLGKKHFEVMMTELDETKEGTIANNQYDKIKKRIDWADCILMGPGISVNDETKEFVKELITNCDNDIVIDADGLNCLAGNLEIIKNRKSDNRIILTPHLGEFARLINLEIKDIEKNRFEITRKFAKEYKVHLVLKSETTLSSDTDGNIFINPTGSEVLATAGTGDVLSGIIASMFAQTKDVVKAMLCGNYIHGLAGDIYSGMKKK